MTDRTATFHLPKGKLSSLAPLRRYLMPYRWAILGAGIALIFTSSAMLGMGGALRYLVDEGLSKGNPHLLDNAFLLLLGVTILLAIASYIRFSLISWVGEKVVADLRNDVYRHLLRMHVGFFETTRTGDLLSRLTADITLLQTVVGSSVSIALRNGLMMIGAFVMLLFTSPSLTVYVLMMLPLVVAPIIIFGRKVRALSRASQDRLADLNAHTEESVSFIRTLQTLSLEEASARTFGEQTGEVLRAALSRIRARALLTAIVIGLIFGAIISVLRIGGHDVLTGQLTPGNLSAFVFYAVMVAGAVGAISEVIGDLQRAAGAMERLLELLALEPAVTAHTPIATLPQHCEGRIDFEHVSFTYPARPDKPALHDFSLHVAPGETVALVGPSGAGKSTVLQLLLRFYDVQSGTIRLDGIDIRHLEPGELRRPIGLVPQDPALFSTTAFENIRYGRAEASEAEVREAAARASALEFLEKLPQGLNTYLGEKGVQLSGGQRQRLAIARAIIRRPRILLLDEATSALDAENERAIQQALESLRGHCTTLVIAHRLATILKADRIVVMNDGRIEAIGSHTELLETSPLYARLAALQFHAG